jgi:antitoxin YefM
LLSSRCVHSRRKGAGRRSLPCLVVPVSRQRRPGWPAHLRSRRHRCPASAFVTRILVMSTQSLASVKAHLSAVVDSVHETHERVTVTKNGVPAVVVVAVEDLESLEETLAILSDEDTMRQLREAEREVAAGDTLDATELRELMDRRALSE